MPAGTKKCQFCTKNDDKKDVGKFSTRKHMVLQQQGFQSFMTEKYEDLQKFKLHMFKLRTLSKVYTTDVRPRSVGNRVMLLFTMTLQRLYTWNTMKKFSQSILVVELPSVLKVARLSSTVYNGWWWFTCFWFSQFLKWWQDSDGEDCLLAHG